MNPVPLNPSPWLPHDLLWGMSPAHLSADAPQWAVEVLAGGAPVVVRRALTDHGWIAVGVRGTAREQRYAALLPSAAVLRGIRPEALVDLHVSAHWPALRALEQLRPVLDASGWGWGVGGSAGYELASGLSSLHEQSDLDLIVRTPLPMSRTQAKALLVNLDQAPCPVDLQLQTPYGAVALREWAGSSSRVLLKTAAGAVLVNDPWAPLEQAA